MEQDHEGRHNSGKDQDSQQVGSSCAWSFPHGRSAVSTIDADVAAIDASRAPGALRPLDPSAVPSVRVRQAGTDATLPVSVSVGVAGDRMAEILVSTAGQLVWTSERDKGRESVVGRYPHTDSTISYAAVSPESVTHVSASALSVCSFITDSAQPFDCHHEGDIDQEPPTAAALHMSCDFDKAVDEAKPLIAESSDSDDRTENSERRPGAANRSRLPQATKSLDVARSRHSSVGTLALWATLVVLLQGALWLSGLKSYAITQAVEQGVARAEARTLGEASESATRKAIRNQRETLGFWTTLAMIGDFVVDPLLILVRATAVATLLSAVAALVGRPIRFQLALNECAVLQGIWVLGLAVQAALMLAFRSPQLESSLTLALPAGTYSATRWVALREINLFSLWGWTALIRGGWSRGQANLATAVVVCGLVALCESSLRVALTVLTGSVMRLMLLPDRF